MSSLLFRTDAGDEPADIKVTMASAAFGERTNGRYKMPLLPGETGPKSGGDWVPRGLQSATNLAGAIVESRQLGIWDRERSQIGLGLRPDLVERLAFATRRAVGQGADFNERSTYTELAAELELIHTEARQTAGANAAAQAGTNRHDVWEERGKSNLLFGTPDINEQIERLEQLLADNHLQRVPGLQERTVRNVALRAAGRFDDVLMDTRTGKLYMADLKTKKRPFWSWLEVRIQLAVYASAEWMLAEQPTFGDRVFYIPGPLHHVSQETGIVMRMPSDGGAPELRKINLVKGLEHARLARAVCDARSDGKSVESHAESVWS